METILPIKLKSEDRVYIKNSIKTRPNGRYLQYLTAVENMNNYILLLDTIENKIYTYLITDIDRTMPLIRNGKKISLHHKRIICEQK